MRRLALTLCCLSLLAVPATASAADFNPAPGTYTIDTTTLKLTGTGTNITGVNQGGVAVFSFGTVNIPSGVTINAAGSRPLKIVASGDLTLAGTINGNGTAADDCCVDTTARPGGPGGGAGGTGSPTVWTKGSGPGGGGAGSQDDEGGGGGGFGGKGARGAQSSTITAGGIGGAGGVVYGNLDVALQGGSGGSGSGFGHGGGGGGTIALFGDSVTIAPGGSVRVDGGGGAAGRGASGGGSGGGIVIHGDSVEVNGLLLARGGDGGVGGCCGDGGGGGGGRIAYQFRTLVASGTALVNGGTSGIRTTGGLAHGSNTSPDPTGAQGVITKTFAATSTTSPATSIASNAATLNGTVNPHKSATRFFFQFGRTTAYGANVGGGLVGSDNVDHAVAAGVGGLAPSTTYHFRIVAVDSLGFVTPGADVGFTTAAAPPPPPPPPAPTTLASTTSINSLAFPKFTKLLALSAKNLPANSKVVVTCKTKKKKQQKKGCPYKKKTFNSARAKSKLDLRKPYKKKKLPVGTKIGITITATGFLGKRVTYTMRAGKLPKAKVQCLTATGRVGKCS